MRTRQTDTPYATIGASNYTHRRVATGTNTVMPPGTVYYGPVTGAIPAIQLGVKSELLQDKIAPKGMFNQCVHEYNDFELYPCRVGASYEYDGTGRVETLAGDYSMWHTFPKIPPLTADRVSVTWPRTVQQLLNKAAHAFYQENKADHLLNAIELKQTLHSLTSAMRFIRSVEGLLVAGRSRYDSLRKSLLSKSLGELNNQFLAYNFGLAPLWSDMKKTCKELSIMDTTLRQLSNHPRRITSTATADGILSVQLSDIPGYSAYAPVTPDTSWWHPFIMSGDDKPRLVVGVHGLDSRTYETPAFRALDHVMKRLVGTGPVSLAWELTKFSFVLDWFVDAKPVLDWLDGALTDSKKTIKYSWYSEKVTCDVRYIKHRCMAVSTAGNVTLQDWPDDGNTCARTKYKRYRRNLLDLTPTVTSSGRFGKKQGLLSLALFYQSVANLKRAMR